MNLSCKHKIPHRYWPSKEGPVLICQMSKSHGANTIRMLKQQLDNIHEEESSAYSVLGGLRGEMAV